MIMNSLLMETRVNSKQNFNSLKGGKYDIKDGIRLIDCLLDKNYIEPITPLIKSNCPVIIDLDFRVESTDEPRQEGIDQMLIDVAHELLKILNEVADFEKANVILTLLFRNACVCTQCSVVHRSKKRLPNEGVCRPVLV